MKRPGKNRPSELGGSWESEFRLLWGNFLWGSPRGILRGWARRAFALARSPAKGTKLSVASIQKFHEHPTIVLSFFLPWVSKTHLNHWTRPPKAGGEPRDLTTSTRWRKTLQKNARSCRAHTQNTGADLSNANVSGGSVCRFGLWIGGCIIPSQ